MIDLGSMLPHLLALPEDEALTLLRAAWRNTTDRPAFTHVAQGALAYPGPHPMVALVLNLAGHAADLDVEVELRVLWDRWATLDLATREALARAVARRAGRDPELLGFLHDHMFLRPEIGELLVPIFLADPFWFAENAEAIFIAYPHAKPAIAAAGQLLLQSAPVVVEHEAIEQPHAAEDPAAQHLAESRQLLGQLLDYDAKEVFEKLHDMLTAAPELGEALILEMAARGMDLRGVVVALRDQVDRDRIKAWLQAAVDDELQLLVYLAMT